MAVSAAGYGLAVCSPVQRSAECPLLHLVQKLSNYVLSRLEYGLAVCSQCAARCRFTCLIMFLVSTSFARYA